MVSGEMTCVKYLLFCFNLIFVISGIAIITVGATIYASANNYPEFVDNDYVSAALVFIVVGVVVFIIAFFGCCGAIRQNHCMTITFSVFLLIIFTLELAVGIAGYVRHGEVESMLKVRLNETMMSYTVSPQIRKTWNTAQHELQCCGIKNKNDWENIFHNNSLPYTCCQDDMDNGSCTTESNNIYQNGCLQKLKESLESAAFVLGGVGIGIAVIQLLGVAFACMLARSIRKEYETV